MTTLSYSITAGGGDTTPPERLHTAQEVCEWLNIGATTLHKLRVDKKIIPIKIRGRILYDPADVRMYLKSLKEDARLVR